MRARLLILAAFLLAPLAASGQTTLVRALPEPLPACTPSASIAIAQPQVWDITAQQMKTCTAPNTWTSLGGGSGSSTYTALTPGTLTNATGTYTYAPSAPLGSSASNWSWTGATGETNTAPVITIGTPSGSTQAALAVNIQGIPAFQVIEITGNNQQTVSGFCATSPAVSGDLARFDWCFGTAGVAGARVLSSSAAFTGSLVQSETVTALGAGFKLFSGRVGCSADGTCAGGSEPFNVLGNGVINAQGLTLNGSTSGSMALSVTATGSTLNLGANATLSSAGLLTVVNCTGCGVGTGTVTHTAGALTAGQPVLGNGGADIAVGPINLAGGSSFVTGLLPHANLAATAVTPGSYTNSNITVAADGTLTAASNGSAGGSNTFPLTVAGTVNSGGIPCFTSTTVEATSATLAAGVIPKGGGSGACIAASSLTDSGSALSTTEPLTVGVSLSTTADGFHSSQLQMVGNTANFGLGSSLVNLYGPNIASFSSYGLQFSSIGPTAAGTILVGAPSVSVSQLTYGLLPLSDIATQAADSILANASGISASPTAVPFPTTGTNGCSGVSDALGYNNSTHTFICTTIAGSGSGTVNSGITPRLAFYASSSTAVSDTGPNLTWVSPTLTIGVAGVTAGGLQLATTTANGSVTLLSAAAASNFNVTVPAATDTLANLSGVQTFANKSLPINDVVSATGPIAAISNGNNGTTLQCALTTVSTFCLNITESAASSATGVAALLHIATLSNSTLIPFEIAQGLAPNANSAPALISISSAATGGGANPTTTGAGHTGAFILLLTGAGSNGGSTSGNAGPGGGFTLTEGNGGTVSGASNNGGAGGGVAWTTGNGGNGGASGIGGAGGNFTLALGTGGTGGTAGVPGQFIISGGLGISSPLYATTTNCSSGASPAVCAASPSGAVAVPAGTNSTLVVDTTAVTANSQILLQSDDTLGTKLSVTCNTTLASLVTEPVITARSPGTSFTITISGTTTTNPVCLNYAIIN